MSDDPLVRYLENPTDAGLVRLIRETRAQVFAVAYAILGDPEAAEDVTVESYDEVWGGGWRPEKVRSGRGKLCAVARTGAKMAQRGKRRRRCREEVVAASKSLWEYSKVETALEVDDALSQLSEEDQKLLTLCHLEERNVRDVAALLHLPLSTTHVRLKRAEARLKALLSPVALAFFLPIVANMSERSEAVASEAAPELAPTTAPRRPASARPRVVPVSAAAAILMLGTLSVGGWALLRSPQAAQVAVGRGPAVNRAAVAPAVAALDEGDDGASAEPAPRGPAANETPAEKSAPAPAAADEEAKLASVAVTVRTAEGTLAREGELKFQLPVESLDVYFRLMESRPISGQTLLPLLEPQPLTGRNPFVVEGLFEELTGQDLEVRAQVPGYAPQVARFQLEPGKRTEVELVVARPSELRVRVRDAKTSAPVSGAVVLSRSELDRRDVRYKDAIEKGTAGTAKTGGDGRCVLSDLGPGEHSLEVLAEGYGTVRRDGVTLDGELEFWLNPASDDACEVTVHVLDPDGKPLEGVEVEVLCGQSAVPRQTTDTTGVCRFTALPPGLLSLKFEDGGFRQLSKKMGWEREKKPSVNFEVVHLEAGEHREVTLGYRPVGSLSVRAVDPSGQPVAGLRVKLSGWRDKKTGKDGWARFNDLPEGSYTVDLGEEGDWSPKVGPDVEVEGGQSEELVWMVGSQKVRGRVVRSEDGTPVARARVSLDREDRHGSTNSDDEGRFEFESVLPGRYEVSVWLLSEPLTDSPFEVVVPEKGDVPEVEVRMDPAVQVLAFLEPEGDGALRGGRLECLGPDGKEVECYRKDLGTREEIHATPFLRRGTYTLRAHFPGGAVVEKKIELEGAGVKKVLFKAEKPGSEKDTP